MCLVIDKLDMVDFSPGMLTSHLSPISARKSRNPTFTLSGKEKKSPYWVMHVQSFIMVVSILMTDWLCAATLGPLVTFFFFFLRHQCHSQCCHKTINDSNTLKIHNTGWIYNCNRDGLLTFCPLSPGAPSSPGRPFLPCGGKRRGLSRPTQEWNHWNVTFVWDHYLISLECARRKSQKVKLPDLRFPQVWSLFLFLSLSLSLRCVSVIL